MVDLNFQIYDCADIFTGFIEIQNFIDNLSLFFYNKVMDTSMTYILDDDAQLDRLASALNSSVRRKMLRLIGKNSYNVAGLAEELNLSISTTTFHLNFLKEAELVKVLPNPNKRGNEKIVSQGLASVTVDLKSMISHQHSEFVYRVPIGSYSDFDIKPPCALVTKEGMIYMHDNPNVFRTAERFDAILLSFSKGFVEYTVPAFEYSDKTITSFTFSLELCSECPNYNNAWKSDITFWINGKEVCTWRSQGDYGDRKGRFPIPNWPANSTQYGMLKKIRIDDTGTYIDESLIGGVKVSDLGLNGRDLTTIRIGIKDSARYVGGVNLFGKNSGDTEQDVIVHVTYQT